MADPVSWSSKSPTLPTVRFKLVDRLGEQDAQDGLEKLSIGKWLGEIRHYASLASGLSRLRGIVGRDQDHWNGRDLGAGVTRHGQAIGLREPEVRHDEIRLVAIDQRHGLGAGVGTKRLVASTPEKPLTARDKLRLVIDDQNRSAHMLAF